MGTFKIVIYHLSFVICHLSFLISHLSNKAKAFDKSFKGGKICIINIAKSFTCGENFDKKTLFFWFSS